MNRFLLCSSALLLACGALAISGCARPVAGNPHVLADNVNSLKKAFGGGAAQGGPAVAAAPTEPTGWATLKGQFKLAGAAPARVPLVISKDPGVCEAGLSEEMVVDSSGGIKDVGIFVTTKIPANDPKWEHPDYPAANAELTMPFDQEKCVFLSHLFIMRSTQTVVIKNSDAIGHNTSINASAGSKAKNINELIPGGGSTKYNPVGESMIPNNVSCSIHPWMTARLLTRNNSFFAVSKKDGTFEIPHVPAGVELEFAVWQEKAGFITKVNVAENGGAAAAQVWKKGRFKKTFTPDQKLDLNVTLDAADLQK